ncbi:MAG: flavodoxin-dependent (E)-4-hydroxy-3-methylbut-2-enyl-diphosphate synthase, partial [Halanaerobiales bacterium]
MERRKSRKIYYGDIAVGGDSPITVQSMTNTRTADTGETIGQIKILEAAGCEIIRVAVPDMESAEKLSVIRDSIDIPLIADIHFDYRLAIAAINQGIDGLRLNPGNIGHADRIKEIVLKAKEFNIPIRVGVNSGSIEREILKEYGRPTAEGMVESALKQVKI